MPLVTGPELTGGQYLMFLLQTAKEDGDGRSGLSLRLSLGRRVELPIGNCVVSEIASITAGRYGREWHDYGAAWVTVCL
jgi:hypothetical protein